MGLTLPLLSKATTRSDANFGRVLGRLYGWNTLGGVAGALGGELWLIESLGLRGTALVAGALNLLSAAVALFLARRTAESRSDTPRAVSARPIAGRSWRVLTAAFLAGATLLSLEVIWFRFLQMFVFGTSFIFAAMLAAILLGIGGGGVIAARWLGRDRAAHRFTPFVALAAGVAVELSYRSFEPRSGSVAYITADTAGALPLFLRLMLPTALLSGVLFTLLGAAHREACGEAAQAAGQITLANTLGALSGSVIAGFVLIPRLGVEKALFAATLSYMLVAWLAVASPVGAQPGRHRRMRAIAAAVLLAIAGVSYPFGMMRERLIPFVTARYKDGDPKLIALREGLTETIMYLRSSFHGVPLHHRLMTNGHSMTATTFRGVRYMKLYAYWALAVNPNARKALLISYGVGNTAKALTDTRQLESIDVVDISRDILELGALAFPGERPPLSDPRVHTHVEDGRFFLQTTDEQFDIITAEPPPLRGAGVSTLYSREYFDLAWGRLRAGGVITYWLPVNQLRLSETKAILRGFCAAFPDCSLWTGAGLQWMLAGTRGAHGPVSEARFSAQWRDPVVAPELADLAFEQPESLGSTFLADASTLNEWTQGVPPLDDDHPGRIGSSYPSEENGDPLYQAWMDPERARERFQSSAFIGEHWPDGLRRRTSNYFGLEGVLDDLSVWGRFNPLATLQDILTHSTLHTLPLLLMGTEPRIQHIAVSLYAAGARDTDVEFEIGARAMSQRDYETAEKHLALVSNGTAMVLAQLLRTLALARLGRLADARDCLNSMTLNTLRPVDAACADWLAHFLRSEQRRQSGVSVGANSRPTPASP
ncbi:MAG: spermidine synthase, partial [Polyangiaceae bacterium]